LTSTVKRAVPYETIKQAILRGELAPGQPLIETALAEWCEVSRTPIREALTKLEHDGLVDRTDRGVVVRMRSPDEILDVYETRLVLEATAARVAADRRTTRDVHLLRQALQRGDVASDSEPLALVEANRQFHTLVWRASHNECLQDLLERLSLHLVRYPATTLAYPGRWAVACEEHTALVDAIEARDGAAAHDLALQHFTEARDIRLRLYDEGVDV
jgi:DNA-binding GntR family transcriptional regulator